MERVLASARRDAEASERAEVAARVHAHLTASGLSRVAFAEAIGTSTSRLSTYLTGKVAPASTLLVRMERVVRTRSRSER
jgi:transcriptional regulator with XRE-family HTH domain